MTRTKYLLLAMALVVSVAGGGGCIAEEQGASTTVTPSPPATSTPATPAPGSPTPGPTVEPTVEPTPEPTAADAEGWPSVDCPEGYSVFHAETRRISACAPPEMDLVQHEYAPDQDGQVFLSITWQNPSGAWDVVIVEVFDKATSKRETLQSRCQSPTKVTILGFEGEQCFWGTSSPNGGISGEGGVAWGIQQFAESPDAWIIGNAAGPQTGPEFDAALERALTVFDSLKASGLEKLP